MKKIIKCLVTGGAGFIGSHLCDLLISKGYEVICIDNLITGSEDNIIHLSNNPRFKFIKFDIIIPFPENIKSILTGIDFVYHLASPASPIQYRKFSVETLLVNSLGTYNMLEIAKKNNSVFLLASTSEVYGNPKVHPQKENYYGNVNPVGLRSCYDEGKRFAEAISMEYFRKTRLSVRIARIFNTYGPRMQKDDGRVVSNFINQALQGRNLTIYGDGTQTRSFCYVDDMVFGLNDITKKKGIDGEVINLGNPTEKTVKEIGELILKMTGSSSKMIKVSEKEIDDPEKRKPDIFKAKHFLNWEPNVKLAEGLKKTIDYFKRI